MDAVRAVVYHPSPRRQDALLRDQDLWPLGDRHELLRTGFVLLVLVIDDRRICVQAETLNLHHLLGKRPRDTYEILLSCRTSGVFSHILLALTS